MPNNTVHATSYRYNEKSFYLSIFINSILVNFKILYHFTNIIKK